MKTLARLAVVIVTMFSLQLTIIERAEAFDIGIDPIFMDVPQVPSFGGLNDPSISLLSSTTPLRMETTQTITPTLGTLTVNSTIWNSGTVAGDLLIGNAGALYLNLGETSTDVMKVTGAVTIGSGGSLVALGITPKPGPIPRGTENMDAAQLAEFMAWAQDDHTVYAQQNGSFSVLAGYSLVALGVMPRPGPVPIGNDPGLLANLIMEEGSSLSFLFADGYVPQFGDSFSFTAGGFSMGNNVSTNLPNGWIMVNDDLSAIYAPVPEPSTIVLLGVGFAGLAGLGYRNRGKKKSGQ